MSSNDLFPTPVTLLHSLAPRPFPGLTAESAAVLQECLIDNHAKHHIFFDPRGFHNHIPHHLLALYYFGVPAPLIKKAYLKEVTYQRSITLGFDPAEIEEVTETNFVKYVGEESYYVEFVKFFTRAVAEIGPVAALEKYIFSEKFNYDPALANEKQPEMLNRYVSSIFHSMIQVGYGFEFNLTGTIIEGLAQCAVHQAECTPITKNGMFPFYKPLHADKGIHAFTVLARILAHPNMYVVLPNPDESEESILVPFYNEQGKHYPYVLELMDAWLAGIDIDAPDVTKKLEDKFEELVWACTLMYGVGGWREGGAYCADFVMAHFVTAVLFIPAHLTKLKPASMLVLLRSYFAVCILWYILEGRQAIDIPVFYKGTSSTPKINPSDPDCKNAWMPIIEAGLSHPDEHLIKLHRALAHFSTIYGTRKFDEKLNTELKGVEQLDGTVFIRVAALSQIRLDRDRFVDIKEIQGRQWDRAGHFN